MFNIYFENKYGKVDFGGGSSDSLIKLTGIDGLTLPPKKFTTISYANQPGQETVETNVNARVITLAGDALVDNDFQKKYSEALVVLNAEGYLYVNIGTVSRRIKCKCSDFMPGERNGAYQVVAIQFICDYPYFEDAQNTIIGLYQVIPHIKTDFSLPMVLSTRTSRNIISCTGAVETEPVLEIDININEDILSGTGIEIINHTHNEKIVLNYIPEKAEHITINVEERKVYTSSGTDLLNNIDIESFLDGFHLWPGENDIEVINNIDGSNLLIMCRYSNKYVEAVY